jgi:hypothetical protein
MGSCRSCGGGFIEDDPAFSDEWRRMKWKRIVVEKRVDARGLQ